MSIEVNSMKINGVATKYTRNLGAESQTARLVSLSIASDVTVASADMVNDWNCTYMFIIFTGWI